MIGEMIARRFQILFRCGHRIVHVARVRWNRKPMRMLGEKCLQRRRRRARAEPVVQDQNAARDRHTDDQEQHDQYDMPAFHISDYVSGDRADLGMR